MSASREEVMAQAQDYANKTKTTRVVFQRGDDQWVHMNAESQKRWPFSTDHNLTLVEPELEVLQMKQDYDGLMLQLSTGIADKVRIEISTNSRYIWVHVGATTVLQVNGPHSIEISDNRPKRTEPEPATIEPAAVPTRNSGYPYPEG